MLSPDRSYTGLGWLPEVISAHCMIGKLVMDNARSLQTSAHRLK